jgi:hypothetical protein
MKKLSLNIQRVYRLSNNLFFGKKTPISNRIKTICTTKTNKKQTSINPDKFMYYGPVHKSGVDASTEEVYWLSGTSVDTSCCYKPIKKTRAQHTTTIPAQNKTN